MTTIDVTSLHAVETVCPSCGSYVHRFLDQCAGCGWERLPAYLSLVPSPTPPVADLPRSRAELVAWMTAHSVPSEQARANLAEVEGIGDREPLAQALFAGLAIRSIPDVDGGFNTAPFLAALGRFFTAKTARKNLEPYLSKLGFHYEGGLPEWGPVDVHLRMLDADLMLTTEQGQLMARIAPEQLMYAASQPSVSGNSSSVGIFTGDVLYFPDLSFAGGALQLAWVSRPGVIKSVVVGNRAGYFTRKGEQGFYYGLVLLLASWANMGAFARQAEVGLPGYAGELGVHPRDPRGPED